MADCKYKVNIKDIQNRYKFKVFMRSGADIPKSITDDISNIKSSNDELKSSNNELKSSIEELKSETNKIIEENIKKKSQNQDMYNALRTIYTNNLKDKVVEAINIFPDLGDLSVNWQNGANWKIDDSQKFENRYTVRRGTNQWSGLHCTINYKKPGQYKFTAYIKSSVDDESIMLYGVGRTSTNRQLNQAFTSNREWQQIEFIFNKSDITVPDFIRLEKVNKTDTIFYISKYELTPLGEIEKIENEPKKITINSLNLIDNTKITKETTQNVFSVIDGEITSNELSGWSGMNILLTNSIMLKKDKIYRLSFDIKGINNVDDFNKALLVQKSNPTVGIETTLNKLVTNYNLTTEYQRYIYYITPKADVETNKIWVQHNGNKQTSNQFVIRNIMLSESSSDWDENYFKKSFIINHFDNTDDKFIELIDAMIDLDLENKRYVLSSE
nr:MAG TPA: hypothetical protein [Caudoviricetes sp.]